MALRFNSIGRDGKWKGGMWRGDKGSQGLTRAPVCSLRILPGTRLNVMLENSRKTSIRQARLLILVSRPPDNWTSAFVVGTQPTRLNTSTDQDSRSTSPMRTENNSYRLRSQNIHSSKPDLVSRLNVLSQENPPKKRKLAHSGYPIQ